jgi:hypothetical protein
VSELAQPVDAATNTFILDEALPAGVSYFRVEDELIAVTGVVRTARNERPDGRTVNVRRGLSQSVQASHIAGTELIPATGAFAAAADPDPFVVGSEQRIRLLGSFHVAHDTAGFQSNNGIVALDVPAGAIVVRAWAFITEDFDDGGTTINIGIGTAADVGTSNWAVITEYTNDLFTSGADFFIELTPTASPGVGYPGPNGGHVFCRLGSAQTAGEADIYALIAEPVE